MHTHTHIVGFYTEEQYWPIHTLLLEACCLTVRCSVVWHPESWLQLELPSILSWRKVALEFLQSRKSQYFLPELSPSLGDLILYRGPRTTGVFVGFMLLSGVSGGQFPCVLERSVE